MISNRSLDNFYGFLLKQTDFAKSARDPHSVIRPSIVPVENFEVALLYQILDSNFIMDHIAFMKRQRRRK